MRRNDRFPYRDCLAKITADRCFLRLFEGDTDIVTAICGLRDNTRRFIPRVPFQPLGKGYKLRFNVVSSWASGLA